MSVAVADPPLLTCSGCGGTFPDPRAPTRAGRRLGRTPKWCSERCRRRTLYAGACVDCGAATNGYNGPGTAAERCAPCTAAFRKWWTRERIVDAIRLFAGRYGRPPAAFDFDPTNARRRGHPDRAARWERDGDYPHATVVQEEFGTWNRGVEAAGFAATPAAARGGPGSTSDAEYVETVRLYERHGPAEAARRLGLTPAGVQYRVRRARERGLA